MPSHIRKREKTAKSLNISHLLSAELRKNLFIGSCATSLIQSLKEKKETVKMCSTSSLFVSLLSHPFSESARLRMSQFHVGIYKQFKMNLHTPKSQQVLNWVLTGFWLRLLSGCECLSAPVKNAK